MQALGQRIAQQLTDGGVLYFYGELGAGKTTLARAILQGMGVSGRIKSPTYTLVEPYDLADGSAYHFDLYRLVDPEELEYLGLRDYFDPGAVVIVEWPERGRGMLPVADVQVHIHYDGSGRRIVFEAGEGPRFQWINELEK